MFVLKLIYANIIDIIKAFGLPWDRISSNKEKNY